MGFPHHVLKRIYAAKPFISRVRGKLIDSCSVSVGYLTVMGNVNLVLCCFSRLLASASGLSGINKRPHRAHSAKEQDNAASCF